jgi:ArsR family transcriptional regulator, cadmium/lead-responsive transcriptional repressor
MSALPNGGTRVDDHETSLGLPNTSQFTVSLIHGSLYCCGMAARTATLSHTAALARLGHALSDPTRAGLLLALRQAPGCPSDLADVLGVSRQVMSNHLACLRGCGLVEAVPDGRRSWYRLTDPHLAPALDELMRVVLVVEPDCCDGEGCTC